MNLILIPKMGFAGAAVATFVAEIILSVMYYFYVSKFLDFYNFIPILIKPLLATAGMVLLIKYSGLGILLLMPLSAALYFLLIFAMGTMEKDDYDIFKKIFRKNTKN